MEVERWSHDTTTNALARHVTKNATGRGSIAREEVVTSPWDDNMGICCLIVSILLGDFRQMYERAPKPM